MPNDTRAQTLIGIRAHCLLCIYTGCLTGFCIWDSLPAFHSRRPQINEKGHDKQTDIAKHSCPVQTLPLFFFLRQMRMFSQNQIHQDNGQQNRSIQCYPGKPFLVPLGQHYNSKNQKRPQTPLRLTLPDFLKHLHTIINDHRYKRHQNLSSCIQSCIQHIRRNAKKASH